MDKKIDITISYEDGVLPDPNRNENALRNINDWLNPLIDEINDNNLKAELYIDRYGIQHLSFTMGISEDLLNRIEAELNKYRYRLTGVKPND